VSPEARAGCALALPSDSDDWKRQPNLQGLSPRHLKWTCYNYLPIWFSYDIIYSYTLYHLLDIQVVGEILENSFFDVSYHQSQGDGMPGQTKRPRLGSARQGSNFKLANNGHQIGQNNVMIV
jgi:hypothetical protein